MIAVVLRHTEHCSQTSVRQTWDPNGGWPDLGHVFFLFHDCFQQRVCVCLNYAKIYRTKFIVLTILKCTVTLLCSQPPGKSHKCDSSLWHYHSPFCLMNWMTLGPSCGCPVCDGLIALSVSVCVCKQGLAGLAFHQSVTSHLHPLPNTSGVG